MLGTEEGDVGIPEMWDAGQRDTNAWQCILSNSGFVDLVGAAGWGLLALLGALS